MDASLHAPSVERTGFAAAVEAALDRELRPTGPTERIRLAAAARHLTLAGDAKRARPALVFSLGRLVGIPAGGVEPLVDAAVAVELIHNASLLHDDIVDDEAVRRGRPTVNATEGNTVAVLTGDFVLARALGRIRHQGPLLAMAIDVIEQMTVAALVEVEGRANAAFTVGQWHAMARGKTGALFGLAAAVPALLRGDGGRAERLFAAGAHLGIAFQIADDAKDLEDGSDLKERNPSFPVAAAAAADASVRAALADLWATPKEHVAQSAVEAVVKRVQAAGGFTAAMDAARAEVAHARHAFGDDVRHADVVEVLTWADALVERAAGRAA